LLLLMITSHLLLHLEEWISTFFIYINNYTTWATVINILLIFSSCYCFPYSSLMWYFYLFIYYALWEIILIFALKLLPLLHISFFFFLILIFIFFLVSTLSFSRLYINNNFYQKIFFFLTINFFLYGIFWSIFNYDFAYWWTLDDLAEIILFFIIFWTLLFFHFYWWINYKYYILFYQILLIFLASFFIKNLRWLDILHTETNLILFLWFLFPLFYIFSEKPYKNSLSNLYIISFSNNFYLRFHLLFNLIYILLFSYYYYLLITFTPNTIFLSFFHDLTNFLIYFWQLTSKPTQLFIWFLSFFSLIAFNNIINYTFLQITITILIFNNYLWLTLHFVILNWIPFFFYIFLRFIKPVSIFPMINITFLFILLIFCYWRSKYPRVRRIWIVTILSA